MGPSSSLRFLKLKLDMVHIPRSFSEQRYYALLYVCTHNLIYADVSLFIAIVLHTSSASAF